jgi:tRNA-dihydrouridine synthase
VKTRIGIKRVVTEEWIGQLLETDPAAITIHGRTQKMMSEGFADWEEVARAVRLRDSMGKETVIIGNGDVMSYAEGLNRAADSGAHGVMIGRGIFSNPLFFGKQASPDKDPFPVEERIRLLKLHLHRFHQVWGNRRNYSILKRFFKIYVNSFRGASELRSSLMETYHVDEGIRAVETFEEGLGKNPSIVKKSTV